MPWNYKSSYWIEINHQINLEKFMLLTIFITSKFYFANWLNLLISRYLFPLKAGAININLCTLSTAFRQKSIDVLTNLIYIKIPK